MINRIGESLEDSLLQPNVNANISKSERYVSIGTGAFIALKGITNLFSSPLLALGELAIGGALLYRGVTGYCAITDRLENNDASNSFMGSSQYMESTSLASGMSVPSDAY
ncbi:YgaP family membrane protein [Rubrolithibacter danxiaensis]|uniref:YgaP family membrane protein n=1 Tax=Rubrolithibacter danxiaensis TaxID=3390805 RepID=UPI003BF825AC